MNALRIAPATSVAASGTFELSDPAAEIYEEKQMTEEAQPAEQLPQGVVRCTVDTTTLECFCIDVDRARQLPMSQQACMAEIRQALEQWLEAGGTD